MGKKVFRVILRIFLAFFASSRFKCRFQVKSAVQRDTPSSAVLSCAHAKGRGVIPGQFQTLHAVTIL